MNSQRLPGKGLREVAGKPLIQYVIDTLSVTSGVSDIIIATSDQPTDDALAEYAANVSLPCIRGSLNNVAHRFATAAAWIGAEAAFRVNGDSPFISRSLFDQAAKELTSDVDLVTNVYPRTFPPGVSVELVRSAAIRQALSQIHEVEDSEHVTRFFYRHPEDFRIRNLNSAIDLSGYHLAVDTPSDMRVFEAMVSKMDQPHWEYSVQQLIDINQQVAKHIGH